MNALDIDLIRKSAREHAAAVGSRSTAHSLERMTNLQVARRTVIFTVGAAGIASLVDRARDDIPGLTKNEILQAAANHNPDIFWAIARKRPVRYQRPQGRGLPCGAAADPRGHAPADRRPAQHQGSRAVLRRAAIGASGRHLCLGDPCQGHARGGDPAGAAENLLAALPGRQPLFAPDHQGRPAGAGAARLPAGRALRGIVRAASADVRPLEGSAAGQGSAAAIRSPSRWFARWTRWRA